MKRSAGLLLYRWAADGAPALLIAHMGGPFWSNQGRGRVVDPEGRAR